MSRVCYFAAVVALSALSSGCCMCDAPYDYCGPTFLGDDCDQCMTDERVGSVLSGSHMGEVVYDEGMPSDRHGPVPETYDRPKPRTDAPRRPEPYYEGETALRPTPADGSRKLGGQLSVANLFSFDRGSDAPERR